MAEPQLPAVIAAVEASTKPIVAALQGAALGGGYELALACDARVAAPGTMIGLPETTLGMIPGAGGTQRLPRLVGTARAIELVCSGRRIAAEEALALRMIDALACSEEDLRPAATAQVLSLAGRKARVIERPLPTADPAAEEAAAATALASGRGQPHIAAAIAHVRAAGRVPEREGLAAERAEFERLRVAPEATALRYVFFAEREAARGAGFRKGEARAAQCFGVVGAGTMGTQIALAILQRGFAVTLVERDAQVLFRARNTITDTMARAASSGRMSSDTVERSLARFDTSPEIGSVSRCDVVIEAVTEDLATKRDVFAALDMHSKPGAVLATNTSYLDIAAIAEVTSRPESVIGLHFFSPAHIMRLLEVVGGPRTSDDALATGIAVARSLGKQAVQSGNGFGFIGNRIYAAYRASCEFMLEDGAFPHEVDAALKSFGFAMGPFAVADMSGLDIAWHMRRQQTANRHPTGRYVTIPDQLFVAGRLGRKAGFGYYRYPDGKRAERDPAVEALIIKASEAAGRIRRPLSQDEIQRRALAAIVNEAGLVVEDGVALRPSDIDVVLINGYGFPRWLGGPVYWAARQDLQRLAADCAAFVADAGPDKRRADLRLLGIDRHP